MRAAFASRHLNAIFGAILSLNRQNPDLAQGQFNYQNPESIDEEDKG